MSFWNNRRVLVTGHTGFKGSWLSFWLRQLGADVCGYSLEPKTTPNLYSNLELESAITTVIGDLRDLPTLTDTIRSFKPEIVFHLAAQSLVRYSYRDPLETYSTNVIGTINVLEAIRQVECVGSVVIVTTDKVYENEERDIGYVESDRLGGFDPYSNSKACAELAVSSYRDSFFSGKKTLIATARAGNVIGGGDWSEDRLLPDVFRSLIYGKELEIRNPNSVRPWQHTLEPLSGYMQLAQKLHEGNRDFANSWNFGPEDEDSKTVGFILDEIKRIWTGDVFWTIAEGDHPHETGLLKLDSTRAKTELGWQPKLRLSDALEMTVDWYRSFKENKSVVDFTRKQIEIYQQK